MYSFIMENYVDFIYSYMKEKNKKIKLFKEDTRKNKDYELLLEV